MKKGFTIIEVLVVIGIIAILTVIVFPSITQIRAKNRDAEKISDIAAIQLGLSLYYSQLKVYPEVLDVLVVNNKYIPADSLSSPNSDPYIYVPLTKTTGGKCTYYHLGVKLELPSGQVDTNDAFNSQDQNDVTNGYVWCGSGVTEGLPSSKENNKYYNVHP